MTEPIVSRVDVPHAHRIVVKVGSSSISGANAAQIPKLIDALAAVHARGAEVILVSSGAIATGLPGAIGVVVDANGTIWTSNVFVG